jgi:Cu2+-exporting ATPase
MFVFLLLLARYIELKGRIAAADSLDHLTKIVPATVRRIGASGDEEIPVVELQPGDRIRVLPGETVPIDGTLLEGNSSFNESLLTGESTPVEKGIGAKIIAGSVNADQSVVVRVTRGRDESTLSEITRLAERGLRSRPRYAELAEKAAVGFVAAILVIAVLTSAVWMHLDPTMVIHNLVAVLIVTCPCALALATPVAMTLSAARITDMGIVPMRMSAMESFATARVLAFDKTGTLTLGRPRLEVVMPLHALTATEARRIAASLEQYSEHPFANAFRHAYEGQPHSVDSLRNHVSAGIEGCIDGALWRIGKPEFTLADRPVKRSLWRKIQALRGTGHSAVLLADKRGPQALFGLMDPPRPSIDAVLAKLRHDGVARFVILSGDHPDNVARMAANLDIEEFHGGLSPAEKLNWIKHTQSHGQRVIMVGDGINDAPTLAAADASFSFSAATNAAQMSSDFVIIRSSLEALSEARGLARRSRRTIRQNLLWAAGYNLSAVPLAALGFVPPWAAAIGMSMSSLLVIGNSMRLRRTVSGRHRSPAENELGTRSKAKLVAEELDVAS